MEVEWDQIPMVLWRISDEIEHILVRRERLLIRIFGIQNPDYLLSDGM